MGVGCVTQCLAHSKCSLKGLRCCPGWAVFTSTHCLIARRRKEARQEYTPLSLQKNK